MSSRAAEAAMPERVRTDERVRFAAGRVTGEIAVGAITERCCAPGAGRAVLDRGDAWYRMSA